MKTAKQREGAKKKHRQKVIMFWRCLLWRTPHAHTLAHRKSNALNVSMERERTHSETNYLLCQHKYRMRTW